MKIEIVDPEIKQIPVEAIEPGEVFRYHLTGGLYMRLTRAVAHLKGAGGEPCRACPEDHVPVVDLETGQVYTPVNSVLVEPVSSAILQVS